jgi:D-alanine transaminase
MSPKTHVNSRYLPMRSALVRVEDRGHQFGDGFCKLREGRLIDERRHLGRLQRSLDELRIRELMSPKTSGHRAARSDCAQSHPLREPAALRDATTLSRLRK